MTNTERLIANLGTQPSITFMVGKYTGNGNSVVAALRRRGYKVDPVPAGRCLVYRLHSKPSPPLTDSV